MSVGGQVGSWVGRHLPLLAVTMTVLALVLGYLAWTARAEAAARSLLVTVTGAPECAPGRDVNDGRRVLVVAAPERRCVVEVLMTNVSDRTVHVDRVLMPDIGTEEHSANQLVVATEARLGRMEVDHPEDGPAASPVSVVVDVDLAPGETTDTQLGLLLNVTNCRGGSNGLDPWPAVAVDVGGRRFHATPSTSLEIELARSLPDDGPGCD